MLFRFTGVIALCAAWMTASTAWSATPDPAVLDALATQTRNIQDCVQTGLVRYPDLFGRVDINVTIETDGTVSSADIENSSLNDVQTAQCVQQVIGKATFAARAEPLKFTWPFVVARDSKMRLPKHISAALETCERDRSQDALAILAVQVKAVATRASAVRSAPIMGDSPDWEACIVNVFSKATYPKNMKNIRVYELHLYPRK